MSKLLRLSWTGPSTAGLLALAVLSQTLLAAVQAPATGQPPQAPVPAPTQQGMPSAMSQIQAPPDYLIGPRDMLSVQVFGEPTLSGNFRVEADGNITMALIGQVKAAGRTVRETENDIRTRLADGFLKNPQVSASVHEFSSQKIFVMGEVRNPGTYPLSGETTLLAAIAMAGSMLPTSGETVIVLRGRDAAAAATPEGGNSSASGEEMVRVNLRDLQSGLAEGKNIRLQHGDTIFVPKPETVYVTGHVRNAGAFAYQRGLTVQQALAMAGGVTDRGTMSRIKITRKVNGVETEIKAKPHDVVQPGDTITVMERFF